MKWPTQQLMTYRKEDWKGSHVCGCRPKIRLRSWWFSSIGVIYNYQYFQERTTVRLVWVLPTHVRFSETQNVAKPFQWKSTFLKILSGKRFDEEYSLYAFGNVDNNKWPLGCYGKCFRYHGNGFSVLILLMVTTGKYKHIARNFHICLDLKVMGFKI